MLQAYGTPNLINLSTGGGAPIIKNFGFDQNRSAHWQLSFR
jgi:hypothetical protein